MVFRSVFRHEEFVFEETLLIFSVPIIELAVRRCGQKSYINRSLNPVCEYRNGIPGVPIKSQSFSLGSRTTPGGVNIYAYADFLSQRAERIEKMEMKTK